MQDRKVDWTTGTSRREALRGLLALGCGVFVTPLPGCSARHETSQAEPASNLDAPAQANTPPPAFTATSPGLVAQPSGDAKDIKVAKYKVDYQDAPRKGRMCAKCANFIAETETCELVEGNISPLGWCKLWVRMKT
jgi:hypothetical protein